MYDPYPKGWPSTQILHDPQLGLGHRYDAWARWRMYLLGRIDIGVRSKVLHWSGRRHQMIISRVAGVIHPSNTKFFALRSCVRPSSKSSSKDSEDRDRLTSLKAPMSRTRAVVLGLGGSTMVELIFTMAS